MVPNSDEIEVLLSKLCTKLGFCLPPEEENRLINSPPMTVDEFTDDVFRAEGLNPEYVERGLYRKVRGEIAQTFEKHCDDNQMMTQS